MWRRRHDWKPLRCLFRTSNCGYEMSHTNSLVTLQVTQTWRGKNSDGSILPLHWAITLRTGGSDNNPIGNRYNAIGNIDTFAYEKETNAIIRNDNWRGSFDVGSISVDRIPEMESILSQLPIIRQDPNWNCQNWVWSGLRELRWLGFAIRPRLTLKVLQNGLLGLLEDWEVGDI
ncbi:hypothetical protein A0H81_00694 [Grifola frondosa]|uniref:Uncharacterized protein n=1 Tax=Grifola frondosa TaxID=5627 RepID=A0A1C7MTM9_GRIFR|nr:hypothetical protein A0H81_00694 [Grifola frondosa]